ncbi:MAG: pseudouridine-5'-phosphate glycosidase, partial [Chloroflexota bacterium]
MIDQPGVQIDDQIRSCLAHRRPVVALESAVLTHGLPAPQNLQALQRMDRAIRDTGATPALCLIDQGSLWIGASYERAAAVAGDPHRVKATARDLGASMARRLPAGLTVS